MKSPPDRFIDADGRLFDVGAHVDLWPGDEFVGTGVVVGVAGNCVLVGSAGGRNPTLIHPSEVRVAS